MTTDEARLRAGDPGGILDAFLSLPEQLASAYETAREGVGERFRPRSVTFCAMGGSAAAADVVAAAFAERLGVPVATVRGYRLPPHCGSEDLVVCLSYSGDTEETVAAYGEAVGRGCRVVSVSAGGMLAARAEEDGVPAHRVADGLQPRAALGLLTGAALGALASLGAMPAPDEEVRETGESVGRLAEELGRAEENEAMETAAWIDDRIPVIWGSEGLAEAAAWRWKCAFNENAKVPAHSSALPELDHHEVAGWSAGRGRGFALVVLRTEDEHPSVGPRLAATLEAVGPAGLEPREVRARGSTRLSRVLSLMLLGDVTSTYHALARGVDPTPIEAIWLVKARLARAAGVEGP